MTDFQQHPVSHLSETQRFRVALARILALEPHLILLDDPFKRLDPHVRYDLFRWLYRLNRHTGHTILMATHFFEGLLEFSDRIAFLNNGIFEHSNAPDIIDAQIPSYMALNLMGESLELPIRIQRDQVFLDAIPLPLKAVPEKGALRVFVRAKDCLLVSWETFSEIQGRYIPLHIRGLIKNIHPTPRNTQHVSIEIPRHNSENLTWGMECSLHEFYTPGDWVAVIIRQVYSLSEDQCSPSVHKCEDFLIPS
jgi:ABC-type sulfate/molybdate transport systems ATPase subunit